MTKNQLCKEVIEIMYEYEKTFRPEVIKASDIAKATNRSLAEIDEILEELEDRGFIKVIKAGPGNHGSYLTSDGKRRVQEYPSDKPTISNYNIGAIIQILSGENIQAIGFAPNSEISQVIGNPENLKSQLDLLAEELIKVVKTELNTLDMKEYQKTLANLQEQILEDKPEPAILKKLLQSLAFLGDIEGTLGLMVRVWPYISPLLLLATQMASQSP